MYNMFFTISIAFYFIIFIFQSISISHAYEPETHSKMVRDAFDYMYKRLAEDTPGEVYNYKDFENWNSEKDYKIAHQWMGTQSTDYPETILQRYQITTDKLDNAASRTDHYRDIYFKYNSFFWPFSECSNEFADHNYTSLSHFLLFHWAQRDLWKVPGYSYELSNRDGLDETAFAFFGKLGGVEVATNCGFPLKYQGDPDLNAPDQYKENWERKLKHIRFPPATSMAWFHYKDFLSSPESGLAPRDIKHLGPVFHAFQDMSVPHHVIGVLGYGHADYERLVEAKYKDGEIFDSRKVKEYLSRIESNQGPKWDAISSALRTQIDIKQIMQHLAHFVLLYEQYPNNENWKSRYDPNSHRYNPDLDFTENIQRAKDLVNLGIAANVVLLRKAISEWKESPREYIVPAKIHAMENEEVKEKSFKSQEPNRLKGLIRDDVSQLEIEDFLPIKWLTRISDHNQDHLNVFIKEGTTKVGSFLKGNPADNGYLDNLTCKFSEEFKDIFWIDKWIFETSNIVSSLKMTSFEIAYLNREPHFRMPTKEEHSTSKLWIKYAKERKIFEKTFLITQAILKKGLFRTLKFHSFYLTNQTSWVLPEINACGKFEDIKKEISNRIELVDADIVELNKKSAKISDRMEFINLNINSLLQKQTNLPSTPYPVGFSLERQGIQFSNLYDEYSLQVHTQNELDYAKNSIQNMEGWKKQLQGSLKYFSDIGDEIRQQDEIVKILLD